MRGVHTFPKGIIPKVNVILQKEIDLVYFAAAVHLPLQHGDSWTYRHKITQDESLYR